MLGDAFMHRLINWLHHWSGDWLMRYYNRRVNTTAMFDSDSDSLTDFDHPGPRNYITNPDDSYGINSIGDETKKLGIWMFDPGDVFWSDGELVSHPPMWHYFPTYNREACCGSCLFNFRAKSIAVPTADGEHPICATCKAHFLIVGTPEDIETLSTSPEASS
jgi:hypothetical protein